jgi:thiol-disulfide isomerase/thioredoxin
MLNNVILERIGIAFVLILAGVGLYWLFTRILLLRARRSQAKDPVDLPGFLSGQPAILYFTTPECVVCRTTQKPALQRLRTMLGERLQLIEINAQEHTDLADRWSVLSVPTTFVLDASGRPQHVNYGAASAEKLAKQLNQVLPGDAPLHLQSGDQCC